MRPWKRHVCAIAVFGVVTLLKLGFPALFTHGMPLLFFPLVVLCCAWFFDVGPGIVIAILSTLMISVILVLEGQGFWLGVIKTSLSLISFFGCLWLVHQIKTQKNIVSSFEQLEEFSVLTISDDARITSINAGGQKLFMYKSHELIGTNWNRLFTGEDIRANTPDKILVYAKEKGAWTGEVLRIRKDGSRFWANVIVIRLRTGFYCIVTDITLRKQAEDALRKWRHIFYHSGWAVAIVDAHGDVITHVNNALSAMHGYEPNELIGKPVTILFAPEFLAELPNHIRSANASEDYIYESIHMRKDGQRFPCRAHVSIFKDEFGKLIYRAAIHQDITEQRKLEHELRQTSEEVNLRDKRKDEFLAILAHELRNPLQAIRTTLYIKNDGMEVINRNLTQIQKLVDDIMDVARLAKGEIPLDKTVFDIRDSFLAALEQSHSLIKGKGHKLYKSFPTDPAYIEADASRIQQIFTNLLNNAAKYTDNGGCIWITAEVENEEIVVKVRDNGIGIESNMLPKVFDMYAQANHRAQDGLGIGLTLVKRLVEAHGGTVIAKSDGPETGSTIIVRLPLSKTEPTTISDKIFTGTLNNRRVLVVDDNIDAATSMQMMLLMDGCEVAIAYNGEEALKVYNDFRPEIVLLDIGLPKMDGYEVAKAIRETGDNVVIIAVTGYGQPSDVARSQEAGFDQHMVKPVEPNHFKKLIQTTFEARQLEQKHGILHQTV
jgi:PAS domain S-box-containing protein